MTRSPEPGPELAAAGPCAWRPAGRGRVHSVYRHSCNLTLEGQRLLLPLLDAQLPLQAHALALALPAKTDCRHWFAPGAPVRLDECALRIGGVRLLRPAAVADWGDYRVPPLAPRAVFPLAKLDAWLSAAVHARPRDEWHSGHAWVRPSLLACLQALYASPRDNAALAAACRGAVGLGAGLTPAGDDFLCGVLASLAACDPARFDVLRRAVPPWCAQTSAVSRDYLLLACDGVFSPLLTGVWLALAANDAASLHAAVQRLLAHGSSSGLDTLSGCVAGLAARHGRLN